MIKYFYSPVVKCFKESVENIAVKGENAGKSSVENITEKGVNAGNQHFLLSPQCFFPYNNASQQFRQIYCYYFQSGPV